MITAQVLCPCIIGTTFNPSLILRSVVSYKTSEVPIYTVGAIEKAANLPVYDSIDSDVLQSYMEYSLASLIYYCLKEGACSEQSSRMTAMDNSSKNAGKKSLRYTSGGLANFSRYTMVLKYVRF